MRITDISIKKPIAVIMIVIACLLFGIMGYMNLGADLFPETNVPVVFISTLYPGAGTEELEKDIAKPIEDAVSSISGIDKVHSSIGEGFVETVVIFKLSADKNSVVIDTQRALDGIANELPKDAMRPTLFKYDDNASPILVLTLSGDKPSEELYYEAEILKERIERVEGIGNVSIFGGKEKELFIRLDKAKLEFYDLSISQISARLQSENVSMPGGTINQIHQDKIIRIDGEFKDINDIKSLRIPIKDGFVQLGDIAEVSLDYPKVKDLSRANGKTTIGLTIQKQSDANIVETGQKAKEEINKLKESLKGTELNIVQDTTLFITSSLNETKRNLIEGVITTAIVLMLFLRQWRSLLIVIISIPTSLVSTFFMMYAFGFTFNMLSLMGLALCVGILVDDSVVVLENIHRHLKMGKDPKTAALEGRSEIGMAAIAITLSDIVIFAPIAFMSGVVGQYFKQFGLTVVFATMFSLIISFTLTPMMASRMFKNSSDAENKTSKLGSFFDNIGLLVKRIYQSLLSWSLVNRFKMLLIIGCLFVASILLIPLGVIGTDFMPRVDEGQFTINIELTPGSTIEQTDKKALIVEDYVKTIPELDYYYTRVGIDNWVNKAQVYVKLVDKKERERGQRQVVESAREWGRTNLTGVNITVNEPSMTGGEGDKPIYIRVTGKKTEVIKDITEKVEKIVKNTPGTIDISNSLSSGQPEINIRVDRVEAARYGVSAYDISNTVRSSIEGAKAGVFRKDGEDYDIRVEVFDEQVTDINQISSLRVANNSGQTIPLSQVSTITLSESPTIIKRVDKQRVVSVSANLLEGYTLGEINSKIQKDINELAIPDGYQVSLGGEQEQMEDTFESLIQVLILSIALVYMILVILYESFLTPFVRILALPVGAIGALVMLAITGKSLNMMSMIGLIMLDGLAAKNGTLLIDYTNTLMKKGLSLRDALYEAGTTRLKPIFMTSLSMMVGILPTALSMGDGSEFKSGMGVVLIGGMITSTILSPILLPVAYTIIDDFKKWLRKRFIRHREKTNGIQESL